MDRANDVWIEELTQPGPRREAALADLRALVFRGLRGALAGRKSVDDAFLEDTVQETLLKVPDRLDTFAGRGRFISWAMAIAVRVALTTIREQRWQRVSSGKEAAARSLTWPTNPWGRSVRRFARSCWPRCIRSSPSSSPASSGLP